MTPKKAARKVSPGRPPKAEVAARLDHILGVAAAEFVSRGYADASVTRIARDAGVSKKTIYARYPNKDALLMAVAGDLTTRTYAHVMSAITNPGADPRQVLTEFATQVATNWAAPESVGVYRLIVSEAVRFPQLGSIYRDAMDRFRSVLADYLQKQCDAGMLAISRRRCGVTSIRHARVRGDSREGTPRRAGDRRRHRGRCPPHRRRLPQRICGGDRSPAPLTTERYSSFT